MAKCAWCGRDKPGMEGSHGICQACIEKYFPETIKGRPKDVTGDTGGATQQEEPPCDTKR